jgi:hypothetical protein
MVARRPGDLRDADDPILRGDEGTGPPQRGPVGTVALVRRSILVTTVGLAAVMLAACGSSGGAKTSATVPSATPGAVLTVGTKPSTSSKMVCGEAKADIAASLGVKPTEVTTPTWIDHVYSCSYVYPTGSFTLSVKEVDGIANAATYFRSLKTTLGVAPSAKAPELGQGAFITKGGGLVVQKDNKVLTVDVSKLPATFGDPAQSPTAVATSIGGVIMGCWTGA